MLDRSDITTAFPFLKSYRVPVRTGCCGGRRQAALSSANTAAAKAVIVGMSTENKIKLRELLGAKELVVFTAGPHGVVKTSI